MTIFADMNGEVVGTPQEKSTTIGKIVVGKIWTSQGDVDLAVFSSSGSNEDAQKQREELQRKVLYKCRDGRAYSFHGMLALDEFTSSMTGETTQTVKLSVFNVGDDRKEELGDAVVVRVTGCRFDEKEVEHGEIDGQPAAFLTFTSDCGNVRGSEARKTITVSAIVAGQELLDALEVAGENWGWIDIHGNLEVLMQDDSKFLCVRVTKLVEAADPTERAESKASRSPSASTLKNLIGSGAARKAVTAKKSKPEKRPFDDPMPF